MGQQESSVSPMMPVKKVTEEMGRVSEVDASRILHNIITYDPKQIENLGLKSFIKKHLVEFLTFLDTYAEHLDNVGFKTWAAQLRWWLKWYRINGAAAEGQLITLVIDALKSMLPAMAMYGSEDEESRGRRFFGLGGGRR